MNPFKKFFRIEEPYSVLELKLRLKNEKRRLNELEKLVKMNKIIVKDLEDHVNYISKTYKDPKEKSEISYKKK